MVYLYLCSACQQNDHKNCERGHPAPPGVIGGSLCRCGCRGNPNWPDYKGISKGLQADLQKIIKFEEESKKSIKNTKFRLPEIYLNLGTFNELKKKLEKFGYSNFIVDNGNALVLAGLKFLVKPPKKKIKGDLITGEELRFAAENKLPIYYFETHYNPSDNHLNYQGKCVLKHIAAQSYSIGHGDINLSDYSDAEPVAGVIPEGEFAVYKIVGIKYS